MRLLTLDEVINLGYDNISVVAVWEHKGNVFAENIHIEGEDILAVDKDGNKTNHLADIEYSGFLEGNSSIRIVVPSDEV